MTVFTGKTDFADIPCAVRSLNNYLIKIFSFSRSNLYKNFQTLIMRQWISRHICKGLKI